jgi:hypothetical protein
MLSLVETQAMRLPVAMREALDVARASAKTLGREESLMPVGSAPTPAGAVRGGLAVRLAVAKAPSKS